MAAADFTIKRNDQLPPIRATLYGPSSAVIDLSDIDSVIFHMVSKADLSVKVDAVASVVDAEGGVVQYDWTEDDTDTAGDYLAEWQVTFTDGKAETFPNDTNITITIVPDLV